MPAVAQSLASLRIFGDDLDPDEITALLGGHPTSCERKGDLRGKDPSGNDYFFKQGGWRLKATPRSPADLDAQVREIFAGLTNDLVQWRALGARYKIDVFCGPFMQTGNDGFSLSPGAMTILSARGIEIGFDLYPPLSEKP